jgi:hypothetical protein
MNGKSKRVLENDEGKGVKVAWEPIRKLGN